MVVMTSPRRIENSVLVVASFTDSTGTKWRTGDRAPMHSRAIRQAIRMRPNAFRMEYETSDVDLEWLDEVDALHEADYQGAKRRRDQEETRRAKALRDELEAQTHPSSNQKQLEKRYEQEKERAERETTARENLDRQKLENELTYAASVSMRDGFHYDN